MPISLNGTSGITFNNGFILGSGQGNVLQIKRAYSGPTRQTITSLEPVLITDLSLSITPISALSTMIIMSNITHTDGFVMSFAIYKDGAATVSTTGQTNTNHPNMQVTEYYRNDNSYPGEAVVMHFETSGSTTTRTYAVYGTSGWAGTPYTFYVNDRNTLDMACFSTIEVMEVLI